jgi:hypothetical protein
LEFNSTLLIFTCFTFQYDQINKTLEEQWT